MSFFFFFLSPLPLSLLVFAHPPPSPAADTELVDASVSQQVVAAADDAGMAEFRAQVVVPQVGMGVKVDDMYVGPAPLDGPAAAQGHQMLASKQHRQLACGQNLLRPALNGQQRQLRAAKAQRQVSDMTNELLKKNAENLKMATIETAKESERGIIDMETLKQTNQSLISTLDEVMKIQEDGRQKRAAAEVELVQLENDIKKKMLELSAGGQH